MKARIAEETVDALTVYGEIPIAFRVETRLRVEPVRSGLGGLVLIQEKVEPPYIKDYDAERGEEPTRWRNRWSIDQWGVLSAFDGNRRVGGAVVAYDTEGVLFLEGRKDLAALWDIRVRPDDRGRGIGSGLFHYAVNWARSRRCRYLKIETQNINVPACRFYAKQGCVLSAINRYVYPDHPEEAELIWTMPIS